MVKANLVLRASLVIYHLISNVRSRIVIVNNCSDLSLVQSVVIQVILNKIAQSLVKLHFELDNIDRITIMTSNNGKNVVAKKHLIHVAW